MFDSLFGPSKSEREKYLRRENEDLREQLRKARKSKNIQTLEELANFVRGRHLKGTEKELEQALKIVRLAADLVNKDE